MARKRDPRRDEAFEIYKEHNGEITNRKIAEMIDVPEKTISAWKSRDKWNVVLQSEECSTTKESTKRERGAPLGNTNAKGNPGNKKASVMKQNSNAEKHGFLSKYLPDETQEIIEAMNAKSAADLMWDQITIQYAAILRAQKIMHVESKDEMIKELKREKMQGGKNPSQEVEYEFQFAWERQAQLLTAQSRAITELRASINHFIKLADEADERRLKLEQMQLSIDKTKVEIDKLGSGEQSGPIEIKIVGKKRK